VNNPGWKVRRLLTGWTVAAALGTGVLVFALLTAGESRSGRITQNSLTSIEALHNMRMAHQAYLAAKGAAAADLPDIASFCRQFPGLPHGLAQADARLPNPLPYRGHLFLVVKPKVEGEYLICAYPERYGETGRSTWVQVYGSGCWLLTKDIGGRRVEHASIDELKRDLWGVAD
jgi:hypothetical protein